jgi:hypothetical protein
MGFPAIAAAIGMLWLLSRIAYTAGYCESTDFIAAQQDSMLINFPTLATGMQACARRVLIDLTAQSCTPIADKAPASRVVGAIVGFLSMFALFFLNVAFVVYLLIEKDAIEF